MAVFFGKRRALSGRWKVEWEMVIMVCFPLPELEREVPSD